MGLLSNYFSTLGQSITGTFGALHSAFETSLGVVSPSRKLEGLRRKHLHLEDAFLKRVFQNVTETRAAVISTDDVLSLAFIETAFRGQLQIAPDRTVRRGVETLRLLDEETEDVHVFRYLRILPIAFEKHRYD